MNEAGMIDRAEIIIFMEHRDLINDALQTTRGEAAVPAKGIYLG